MRSPAVTAAARAAALLDFTLYCNIFALRMWDPADNPPVAPLEVARDYFDLVLDEFKALYNVSLPVLTARRGGDSDGDEGAEAAAAVRVRTAGVPDGLRAALLLTIGNRACVELRTGGDGVAVAEQLFLVSRELEAEMDHAPTLGWTWRAVREMNAAVAAVMHCDFTRGEEAARDAVAVVESHLTEPVVVESDDVTVARMPPALQEECAEHTSVLRALCQYTLGVATETVSCETSLADYDHAIALASEDEDGALLVTLMSQARDLLAVYVEEQQAKARIAAEEAARLANAEKKSRARSRSKSVRPTSSRRTPTKSANTRASQSEPVPSPITGPPVPDVLREHLAKEGLTTALVRVGVMASVRKLLASALAEDDDHETSPQPSLFAGTRFEATGKEALFAVLLCTATPLQWTLRLLKAANEPLIVRHSVWTPRPVLATLLLEMAAERPPAPRSTTALQTRKEIADGNTKLRQQVLQLFAPPAATPTGKQKAHESVDAAVSLLGQRLSLLLKTERSFEEHWVATERIRSALATYAVPQEMVRLKRTLLTEKRLRARREDRGARIIVYFFRHFVKEHALRVEKNLQDRRRFEQREAAAVVLQKYIRRWCAYQEVARRYAARSAYVEQVVVVQSLHRRRAATRLCAARRELKAREDAANANNIMLTWSALEIQRVYRGHCARLRCYYLRGQVHAATLHHLSDSRHYYATVIQKRVRGMLVRRRYGAAVHARRCYGRNVYRTQLWERSCVVIQRAYRAHRARRRQTLAQRAAVPQIVAARWPSRRLLGASAHGGAAASAADTQVAAAHCIQQMYRSCIAKRRLEALRYARTQQHSSAAAPQAHSSQWAVASAFSLKDCVF